MMKNKKKLKPTSAYFLSQKIWRTLRKLLNRDIWTYFYIISQKIKIGGLLKLLENENTSLKINLKYQNLKNKAKSRKKFSFFLKKYNSSKPHGNYRKFLDKFMNEINYPNTILELGISEGAGIYSLRDYYKDSFLWGCDIDKNTFIKNKKITCGYCDQLKISSIYKVLKKFNTKFDLIIDDGWHHPESQINSMIACLPYLSNQGVYITEDIAHDVYKNIFSKTIRILNKKGFKTKYKKFYIPNESTNLAGTLNNGYLFIYRNSR